MLQMPNISVLVIEQLEGDAVGVEVDAVGWQSLLFACTGRWGKSSMFWGHLHVCWGERTVRTYLKVSKFLV